MTGHLASGLTTHKIAPDSEGNLDIEFSALKEIIKQDKCIEFEFSGKSYFLNAERATRYHLRNSISKIKNMVDLVQGQDPVVFDVGANCGIFAAMVKDNYPNSQVFAFEPAVELQKIINANCEKREIKAYNFGIGSTNCTKTLYVNPDSHQTNSLIASNVLPFKLQKEIQSYEIQLRTIDSLISEFTLPSPQVLKVDTQGYEGHVFLGAKNAMQNVQQVFVESSWLDIESITCLLPMAHHYDLKYVYMINSVHAGADLVLSRTELKAQNKQPIVKITDGLFHKTWF